MLSLNRRALNIYPGLYVFRSLSSKTSYWLANRINSYEIIYLYTRFFNCRHCSITTAAVTNNINWLT